MRRTVNDSLADEVGPLVEGCEEGKRGGVGLAVIGRAVRRVGSVDGRREGICEGVSVGTADGRGEGRALGKREGRSDGRGEADGFTVCATEGNDEESEGLDGREA